MPSVRLRIFRPLLCWLIASSILFLWQYHRTRARSAVLDFSVWMEGSTGPISHQATVNGLPYMAREPCGLGSKKLVIEAEGAEPFQTNCFVSYCGKAFGKITLPCSRGRMDLDFTPAVETVRIIGSENTKTLDNIARESLSLPIGRYSVQAQFARFSIERTVDINRNQTTLVAVANSITTLSLRSDPEKAQFELNSKNPPRVSVNGITPATITDLPTGEYELAIARGDYRKNLPVKLTRTDGANNLNVEFAYAKLSISSEPSGATISDDGGIVVGQTPTSLDLQPGAYRFRIVKSGYFETNLSLALSEKDSQTVSVTLANVSFVEAIERARLQSSGVFADYDRALSDVEKALEIKPRDENVLQLKRTIQFNRHLRNARQFQQNRDLARALAEANAALTLNPNHADVLALKGELEKGQRAVDEQRARAEQTAAAVRAEARRKHPEKVMQDVASRLRYHELFETQLVRCNGSLDTVRAAVLRALQRKPEWSVGRDEKPDSDTLVITAATKGFGWKQNAVLVAGQVADNEVVVSFKLLAFVLGDNVHLTLSGISDDSYRPSHPRHAPPARASAVEKNLARDTQNFKERIEQELR